MEQRNHTVHAGLTISIVEAVDHLATSLALVPKTYLVIFFAYVSIGAITLVSVSECLSFVFSRNMPMHRISFRPNDLAKTWNMKFRGVNHTQAKDLKSIAPATQAMILTLFHCIYKSTTNFYLWFYKN